MKEGWKYSTIGKLCKTYSGGTPLKNVNEYYHDGNLKIEATSNQAVCGIIPNNKFQPEFLYYFFSYRKDFLASQSQGGAQPNISQVKIKNLAVPVPPLSEQQSIVATLDSLKSKVDRLQENYDKISQECDALKQAILRQVFE